MNAVPLCEDVPQDGIVSDEAAVPEEPEEAAPEEPEMAMPAGEDLFEPPEEMMRGVLDDEKSFIEDRCAEEVAAGNSEEIAREYAESQVTIRYEEFEKNLPLWSFSRKENPADYRKRLPEELRHLDRLYRTYHRHKYTDNFWPRLNLPCAILGLDQPTFDFLCHAYNKIGNEQVQYYDGCYCLAGFGCAFQPTNSSQIRNALLEIRFALEYFGACIQFLLQHREEYPND